MSSSEELTGKKESEIIPATEKTEKIVLTDEQVQKALFAFAIGIDVGPVQFSRVIQKILLMAAKRTLTEANPDAIGHTT